MIDNFVDSIYEITKGFNDPATNIPLNQQNNNINVVCKNGNVNISLNIDPKFEKNMKV